jgi:phenylpropionate dioxygenase-like ring-hydroxylating dioxygenase large terminal subunit
MHEQLFTDLSGVVGPIETAATLPPACYADASVAEIERDAVFRTSWIGVGRSDQWKAAGDYTALTISDIPVIIIRDKLAALKAFANTCRHRSSKILEGSGNAQAISCPFHRWTYNLDGDLRAAPDMPEGAAFDKTVHGLIKFRTAERDGFSFICFDESAMEIDEWLGDFSDLHAPWSLGSLVTTRRIELEVECNWKGFLEVFNEYYHLPYVHAESFNNVYARPDTVDQVTGQYSSQFGATEGTGGLLEATQQYALPAIPSLDGRNRNGTRYTWMFPNMSFAASTEAMWIYEATPLETGRCRVVMSVCFPPESIAHEEFDIRAQVYYDRMDAALAEDIPALEPSVASFAIWYAGRMRKVA